MRLTRAQSAWTRITPPVGFGWQDAPVRVEQRNSEYRATLGFEQEFEGTTFYVATPADGGSPGNDGLTPETPLSSIYRVFATKTGYGKIMVKGGLYYREAWSISPSRNVAVIGYDGPVILTAGEGGLTWTADGTYPNVYSASRSAVRNVLDRSNPGDDGDPQEMTEQASVADVDANPGSWYQDGSGNIYVQTFDSRAPDTDVVVLIGVSMGELDQDVHVYMEGLEFWGGGAAFDVATSAGFNQRIHAKNCAFKYASERDGLDINGTAEVLLENCTAAHNYKDGFNYKASNGIVPKVIEVNCEAWDNGRDDASNNNGSSMHDGGTIIRVGGAYWSNEGPNVADVGTGGESWGLGVTAHSSTAPDPQSVNFLSQCEMWLDGCASFGSVTDLDATNSGDVIRLRNHQGGFEATGSGEITHY